MYDATLLLVLSTEACPTSSPLEESAATLSSVEGASPLPLWASAVERTCLATSSSPHEASILGSKLPF